MLRWIELITDMLLPNGHIDVVEIQRGGGSGLFHYNIESTAAVPRTEFLTAGDYGCYVEEGPGACICVLRVLEAHSYWLVRLKIRIFVIPS